MFDKQDRQRMQAEVEKLLLGRTIKSVDVSKIGTVELLTDQCERVYLESGGPPSLDDYTSPVVVRSLGKTKKVTAEGNADDGKIVISIGRRRMNDFVKFKKHTCRIIALYRNPNRAWISNLTQPFHGTISEVVPIWMLTSVK